MSKNDLPPENQGVRTDSSFFAIQTVTESETPKLRSLTRRARDVSEPGTAIPVPQSSPTAPIIDSRSTVGEYREQTTNTDSQDILDGQTRRPEPSFQDTKTASLEPDVTSLMTNLAPPPSSSTGALDGRPQQLGKDEKFIDGKCSQCGVEKFDSSFGTWVGAFLLAVVIQFFSKRWDFDCVFTFVGSLFFGLMLMELFKYVYATKYSKRVAVDASNV